MTTWILILTLIGSSMRDGYDVEMKEFSSKESCMAAGNAWKAQIKESGYVDSHALCVQK